MRKWIRNLLLALALVLVVAGAWFFLHGRVIKVWVYTDYAFRYKHPDWPVVVEGRFREVNRIYQKNGTRVGWVVVNSSETDPTKQIPGIDNRRANMVFHVTDKADVFVVLTGVQEPDRTGSVSPFARYAVVVDFPDKSEAINGRLLAHELAHLFGAPHDPGWLNTLMADKPESADLSPRTASLIRKLRNYPFNLGIDGLTGSWEESAVDALTVDDTSSNGNPVAHAHTVVGIALLNERKRDRALVHLRQALQLDPNNVTMRYNLAEAYTRNGEEDKALEQVKEIARMEPNKALTHRALGAMLGRTHQPDLAIKELQMAAQMEPNNFDTVVLLATQQAAMFGHLDDAIATFGEAVRINPNSQLAKEGLQKAQLMKERLTQALEFEREKTKSNPTDPDAFFRLAKAEAYTGDLAGSVRDYQKSAALRPTDGAPHAELAELYYLRGDTAGAWDEVRKARALGTEPEKSLIARLPAMK